MKIEGIENINISNDINKQDTRNDIAKEEEFQYKLEKALKTNDKKQLKKACQGFEKVFLDIMFKQMKATIPHSGLIPKSYASETYESMFYENLSSKISEGKGVGLSNMLYKQLVHNMDNKNDVIINDEEEKIND